ncbi:MAG: FAD-dependent oxidoreductase [Chloroflexota bacterium]|nr:MAG: FAD-dependent oxidoreductase [Chloroflexota bacterium]
MSQESRADILIVGGGAGGCAAAIAATALGKRVVLSEATDWIGGQFTAQAVPPDEHRHIEGLPHGCTLRYRQFRDDVRQYYRDHYPLTPAARADPALNPGKCWVSRLCIEPRIALAVLEQMMAQARSDGLLDLRLLRQPTAVAMAGDRALAVTLRHRETGAEEIVQADYILDATDLGDLLPLAGVEYVTGAESQAETGESHAVSGPAQPGNVQAFTWCYPVAYDPHGHHVIDRPAQYQRWSTYVPKLTPPWSGRLLDWTHPDPATLKPTRRVLFPREHPDPHRSLWLYRRMVCADLYPPDQAPHEVTLVNWPQNDYFAGNIIDQPPDVVERHLEEARQLSLSLLYWLQTEAPRPDGGAGYPGLYLRPDLVGTVDGLAKSPYIRESRRIRAEFTVTEQHIGAEIPGRLEAKQFDDAVGIACWHSIDLHPTTGGDNYVDINTLLFQIPLGALLPIRVKNVLPACKNLGVTHVTNGCYREHTIEWSIGEITGLLAAFCLDCSCLPRQVRSEEGRLRDFQHLLSKQGIELTWPRF